MRTLKTIGDLKAALASVPDDAAIQGLGKMRVITDHTSGEATVDFTPSAVVYGRPIEVVSSNGERIEIRGKEKYE